MQLGTTLVTTDIVIPVRDGANTIAAAIESVLAQSDARWRLIVVDDGSTDDTCQVVREFDDDRILMAETDHQGVGAARNKGIALGSSPFVGFLDCDDALLPEWVSMLRPGEDVGMTRAGAVLVGSGGSEEVRSSRGTPLLAGMFVVRREILEAIGGYDQRLQYSENTDLSYRIGDELGVRGLRVRFVDRPLVVVQRRHDRATRYTPIIHRDAAELMLDKHQERFSQSPITEANYHAIAGYNSLIIGDRDRARRHLRRAVRLAPRRWRYVLRLAQSYVPWRRSSV